MWEVENVLVYFFGEEVLLKKYIGEKLYCIL